jgi:hypothetical protein
MNVTLTQPVEIALRTLGEDDRQRVTAWFDHLKNWGNDDFVRRHPQKLNPGEDVYVLKAGTDLRIFFRLDNGGILVLDIASKDTIERFGRVAGHGHP